MICSIEGCPATGRLRRGMCNAHYFRWWRGQSVESLRPITDSRHVVVAPVCSVRECDTAAVSRGRCQKHAYRVAVHGSDELPEHNYNWQGDDISYRGMHRRLNRKKGRARDQVCECGGPASDWSYDHLDPEEKEGTMQSGASVRYSVKLSHYQALCRGCHTKRDR